MRNADLHLLPGPQSTGSRAAEQGHTPACLPDSSGPGCLNLGQHRAQVAAARPPRAPTRSAIWRRAACGRGSSPGWSSTALAWWLCTCRGAPGSQSLHVSSSSRRRSGSCSGHSGHSVACCQVKLLVPHTKLVPFVQEEHPALQLLLERMRSGSRPGARTDRFKLGLAVEGGGMRGCVSAGGLRALHDLGAKCAPLAASTPLPSVSALLKKGCLPVAGSQTVQQRLYTAAGWLPACAWITADKRECLSAGQPSTQSMGAAPERSTPRTFSLVSGTGLRSTLKTYPTRTSLTCGACSPGLRGNVRPALEQQGMEAL